MFSESEKSQYSRQLILPGFGEEKQLLLKHAKVLVVGAGGLGCPILLYLAAAGVGTIGIMDGDTVDISNLHRQVLYTHGDIGKNKADAAASRLQGNNPHVAFDIYPEPLSNDNVLEILPDYDIIIDGTDNFQTRYLINDACVILDKPFVYGAITKFEGQVCVFNYLDGPTYRCLFPEPPAPGTVPSCAEVGVIGVLPGLIGSYQAMEAIKVITGIGRVRSGKLLMINTLNNSQYTIEIQLNPENKKITELSDYEAFCGLQTDVTEITAQALKSKMANNDDFTLLDVRTTAEVKAFNIGGVFIPLGELPHKWQQVALEREVVVVCQKGQRSIQAAKFLQEQGFKNVQQLKGGLSAW